MVLRPYDEPPKNPAEGSEREDNRGEELAPAPQGYEFVKRRLHLLIHHQVRQELFLNVLQDNVLLVHPLK